MHPGEIVAALIVGVGIWLFYMSRKRVFDRPNAFRGKSFPPAAVAWSTGACSPWRSLADTGALYLAWFRVVGYVLRAV